MDATIKDFLKDLESHLEYSKNTYQAYTMDLRRFVAYLTQNLGREPQVADLSPDMISAYLEAEKKQGYKTSTLYRRRSSLRKFVQYLMTAGICTVNLNSQAPFLKPKERRQLTSTKKIAALSLSEISRLVDTLSFQNNPRAKRDLAIIMVLLETGISISELVQIDLSHLDLKTKRLHTGRDGMAPKTLMISGSAAAIMDYLVEGRPELTQSPAEKGLFVSQMGGRITRQGVWHMLRNRGKEVKLKKTLTPRLIRHTAAQQMIIDGRSVKDIQQSLGHRNQFSTRSLVRRLKRA